MNTRRILVPTLVAAVAVAGSVTLANVATAHPAAATHGSAAAASPSKHSLLHPKKKYFGVFAPDAPFTLSPLQTIKKETGKEPNLDVWYQDWGSNARSGKSNFPVGAAQQACGAGVLPMFTWESWDTSVTKSGEGAAYAQPKFAVQKIINGDFDTYIRNTAIAIRSAHCPVAVRLDQEQNGYWYPWGFLTTGMGSAKDTAARYAAMWRHVWRIFHAQHASNVLWVWSPNFQGLKHKKLPSLRASYPGNKYVDWVGMDGYYKDKPKQTFAKLFGPTMKQMKFASHKPWIVSETAVGPGPTKPKQIKNLLKNIADRKQFNGFIYFDYYVPGKVRSDWKFEETHQSLAAFKAGISNRKFASARPGTL